MNWQDDAACATTDPDLFFPANGDRHTAERAREVCRSCPVINECLEFALANEEREGIWAALNGPQLARLRKKSA